MSQPRDSQEWRDAVTQKQFLDVISRDEATERLTYYLFDYNVIDPNLRSLNTTAEQEAENLDAGNS